MKRVMKMRIAAGVLSALAFIAASGAAHAAVWEWGCQGRLGAQQVIFNRYSMVVVDTKQKLGDIRKLKMDKIDLPPGSPAGVSFDPQDVNGGLIGPLVFTRDDDAKRKLTLTEKSSRKISHKHKMICGRDEDTDITRK